MTNREKLRMLIGDRDKVLSEPDAFGTGDGATKYFRLSLFPIHATTEVVVVDNVAQTRTSDYTIDNDTGLLTFASAPSNGAVVKAQAYTYNAFSDDEIDQILSDYGNDLNLSAAHCCRALATDAARFFAYSSGDEKVDRTKESEHFLRLAEMYEAQAAREQTGDIAIGLQRSEIYGDETDTYGILQD